MNLEYWIVQVLLENKEFFYILLILLLTVIWLMLLIQVIKKIKEYGERKKYEKSKEELRLYDFEDESDYVKNLVMRKMLSPDGVNPNPNGYLEINDLGSDIKKRSFTVIGFDSNKVNFAKTLEPLFNFENCTYSIHLKPIPKNLMKKRLNKQVSTLDSEKKMAVSGTLARIFGADTNRYREVAGKQNTTEAWANELESDKNSFCTLEYVFTLEAETEQELNNQTELFVEKALGQGVHLTSCFGVQSEAFLSNLPLNQVFDSSLSLINANSTLKKLLFDQFSAAAGIFDFTQRFFTHENGVPVGRDMDSGRPFSYDPYDESHDGFTIIIAGKTNSGKSVAIKVLSKRLRALQKYRFGCVDSQKRTGLTEGEYAGLCESMGGINFQISAKSTNILNFFDINESVVAVKVTETIVRNIRTLELADKIVSVTGILMVLALKNKDKMEVKDTVKLEKVIKDTVKALYEIFEIKDGDPDSIYEPVEIVKDGKITSGKRKKTMPTVSNFIEMLLRKEAQNTDSSLRESYSLAFILLNDCVREMYISKGEVHTFTKSEYDVLPKNNQNTAYYTNKNGEKFEVYALKGTRPYYDGQNPEAFGQMREVPFFNIDISQVPKDEQDGARTIGLECLNEYLIKPHTELENSDEKIAIIEDEAHESYEHSHSRRLTANYVRTFRKLGIVMILGTQRASDHGKYEETLAIWTQAATRILFKHEESDRDWLLENTSLNATQVDRVIGLGANELEEYHNSASKNKHRGECCFIDGAKVAFVKVDYLKNVEGRAAETTASAMKKLYKSLQ